LREGERVRKRVKKDDKGKKEIEKDISKVAW